MDPDKKNKEHRGPKGGRKFEKKAGKKLQKTLEAHKNNLPQHGKEQNVKGHSVSNKTAKKMRQSADNEQLRLHAPIPKRTYGEPPPKVVAIVGPPKSGKTTLMKSLIKNYTKHKVTEINGPITVRAGKNRITLMECPNDLNAMMDMSKVVDLVLLLIDASQGFEMESFEFLNILQVHGFTRVMGVLTHLDAFKDGKQVRKLKKQIKHRFWTEVCEGSKVFFLSGLRNDLYTPRETLNLARFVSLIKPRPLIWRTSHPGVLVDRFEDITDPEIIKKNSKASRHVCFYGYVRGTFLRHGMPVHIPGCGDFNMKSIASLEDPLPITEKKRKTLGEKYKGIYGPMSNLGDLVYDRDAIYLEVDEQNKITNDNPQSTEVMQQQEQIFKSLQQSSNDLNSKLKQAPVSLLKKTKPISLNDDNDSFAAAATIARKNKPKQQDDDDEEEDDYVQRPVRRRATFMKNSNTVMDKDDDVDGNDDEDQSNMQDNETERFISQDDVAGDGDDDIIFDDNEGSDNEEYITPKLKVRKDGLFEQINNEDEDILGHVTKESGDTSNKWKETAEDSNSGESFYGVKNVSLQTLVYGNYDLSTFKPIKPSEKPVVSMQKKKTHMDQLKDMFGVEALSNSKPMIINTLNDDDCTKDSVLPEDLTCNWDEHNIREMLRNKFVTGDWSKRNQPKNMDAMEEDDEEVDPDDPGFEMVNPDEEEEIPKGMIKDDMDMDDDDVADEKEEAKQMEKKRIAKKQQFDQKYDAAKKGEAKMDDQDTPMEDTNEPSTEGSGFKSVAAIKKQFEVDDPQMILNKKEFEGMDKKTRELVEGFAPGTYVRIEIADVPCEFITEVNVHNPILIGGLRPEECRMGYIRIRLKRHRWHPKILKNRDPLIFSMGWRRFQSIPVYCMQDTNGRHRAIKYTPEHMHCIASIYGPFVPQNTGVVACQTLSSKVEHFRISATGYTMEMDHDFSIMKKLKLVGTPRVVQKNTAFITGMFNSELECAKFEGASIRTVSGIRGQIKRPIRGENCRPGDFRATFEDKILSKDIVSLRCWYPIDLPKLYNPVLNHLTEHWIGMRTVFQLRKLKNLPVPSKPDSDYKEIKKRSTVGHDAAYKAPKRILSQLPFAEQNKQVVEHTGLTDDLTKVMDARAPVHRLATAILSDHEVERLNTLKKLQAIDAERQKRKNIRETKLKMKVLQTQIKETRERKKREREKQSKRHIHQEMARVKKAKYTTEDSAKPNVADEDDE